MKKIIYKADKRGVAEHGWLHSKFSFSFADYYDPDKMGFGMLRVLNDDIIEPDSGFGNHPHNNMEIISIVREGTLTHKDSMGSKSTITPGEVQVMSAGTGIMHSEYNNSADEKVHLLQIWIIPKERSIKPIYDQKYFEFDAKENFISLVVSGNQTDGILYIHQNAAISIGKLSIGSSEKYNMYFNGNGAYLFLISGALEIDNNALLQRDAIGIYDTDNFTVSAKENAEFIIIEVPMNLQD